MTDTTVILITGVARGIGNTLLQTYLSRPNHTVIGSVRDPKSPSALSLSTLPTASGSTLHIIEIESNSPTSASTAISSLHSLNISHIDTVISNAGGAGASISPLASVSAEEMTEIFRVNALGPLHLFQAVKPLLEKSQRPVWVGVSSAVGSIGAMEGFGAHVAPAYGVAKAALNWVTVAAHSGDKSLIAFVVHPGLVQTDGGNKAAQGMGMEKAPHTKEQSVNAIIKLVDEATRETTSGKFINVIDGTELPW